METDRKDLNRVLVRKEGVVLEKTMFSFENEAVLNPAILKEGNTVHMFYRAVRNGNFSTIGYCRLDGPLKVKHRNQTPLISPEFDHESHGIEDPRIVKIDDTYYLTYTAFDGRNALGCLATSKDLIHFEKKGIIVPQISFEAFTKLAEPEYTLNEKYSRYNKYTNLSEENLGKMLLWDKNVGLFPRKINGKFCFLHRIKPEIQIVMGVTDFNELSTEFYRKYLGNFKDAVVMRSKFDHEVSYIGGGCPPIETAFGWLLIYHGVRDGLDSYIYSACAALLNLDNPQIEISRLPYPLFQPELDYETNGSVSNVCFPTGTALFGDLLYIYYGAADERIACASVSLSELLTELNRFK